MHVSLSLPFPSYIRTFPPTFHHPLSHSLSSTPSLSQTFPQTPSETMAKLGKLTKLKSAIKRWPSLSKLSRNSSCVSAASTKSSEELHAVYVGKSRRRYLVNSDVIDHPLFQELVDRSSSSSSSAGFDDGVVVACEVVLFEHLLWMLESAETQLGSMAELVEFYTCSC